MSVNKVNSDGSLLRVAGGTLYADAPIGTISPFGGSTIPNGYLLCDGQAVSRTTYAELFAVIGTAFGTGDGSTTFNVPDLREATTKGVGLSGKSGNHYGTDGVALGEFIDDRVQDHLHRTKLYNQNYQIGGENVAPVTENGGSGVGTVGDIVVGRHGATTEVKAVGVNYIIKAKQVAVPFDVKVYMSPDYANITQISTSTSGSYTVEEDGFIDAQVLSSSGTSYIKINGGLVATNGNQSANNYAISLHHFGKVSQGDVIEWLGSHNAGVYIAFVPHK